MHVKFVCTAEAAKLFLCETNQVCRDFFSVLPWNNAYGKRRLGETRDRNRRFGLRYIHSVKREVWLSPTLNQRFGKSVRVFNLGMARHKSGGDFGISSPLLVGELGDAVIETRNLHTCA